MFSSADIKYFIEISKTQNISRAAERLGVTQPALSHCLRRMEADAGVKLFIRSKKGVELSVAGKRLLINVNKLQNDWDELARTLRDEVQEPIGEIRLGCHTAVALFMLPQFMPRLTKDHPAISIKFEHDLSRKITEGVLSSKIDVGIVVNPIPHDELIIRHIVNDTVGVWRPKNCMNKELLIYEPSLIQTNSILAKLQKKKIHYSQKMESSSLEVIAMLLAAGVGNAVLPGKVVEAFGIKNVELVKNTPVFEDRVCLIYKKEFRQTARGKALLSYF